MSALLSTIGERLREYRRMSALTTEEVAAAAGISRALLYRYESGDVVKLEVLERLAAIYRTPLASLLGPGNEYVTHGLVFFDRVQRLEEQATQITVVFGPQAYVLSSSEYDDALKSQLTKNRAGQLTLSETEAERLVYVLRKRKETFQRNGIGLVNIVPLSDVEHYLAFGLGGHAAMSAKQLSSRRSAARKEVQRLLELIAAPPLGVQIGVTTEPLPTAGFEIIHFGSRSLLVLSPFRVVEPINIHYGVATFTEDEHVVRLHEDLVARLWATALRGKSAMQGIARLLREAPT